MNTFLPNQYKSPTKSSKYMKFEEGENRFRVLSSAIVGYEYWTPENKPIRLRENPLELPANIREGTVPKHFWAFVAWDYKDKQVKILEVTQVTIQDSIKSLVEDEDWGDPKQYDIVVKRSGEGLETKYSVSPKPHSELSLEAANEYESQNINLEALFDGDDPWNSESVNTDVTV